MVTEGDKRRAASAQSVAKSWQNANFAKTGRRQKLAKCKLCPRGHGQKVHKKLPLARAKVHKKLPVVANKKKGSGEGKRKDWRQNSRGKTAKRAQQNSCAKVVKMAAKRPRLNSKKGSKKGAAKLPRPLASLFQVSGVICSPHRRGWP